MAKFKIQVDTEAIKKKIEATEEQIKQGVEQGLRVCASEIKQMEQKQIENTTGDGKYVPTGQLKRSVTIMPIEWSPYGASITVVPMASYAQYVEQGTGIYNPQGRQGGWVYPIGDGTYRFTMGIPPHYFVQDTYEFYKDKAPAIIKEQIYKCMK
jgi:hypothetical protein